MQKLGDWANTETFVAYMWLSINEGGRRILEDVQDSPGGMEEQAADLWWKMDRALSGSLQDRTKKPEHDLFFNLLTISLSRVDFEQLIRKA